jgi:TPR repeat protein
LKCGICFASGLGCPAVDFLKAFFWYEKSAAQGNLSAVNNMGFMYQRGQGVEKNEELAADLYRKAAEDGLVSAMFNLGRCYASGIGVSKDFAQAIVWLEKAAENGHVGAAFEVRQREEKEEKSVSLFFPGWFAVLQWKRRKRRT